MANEPSWEDIFNPAPEPSEPARRPVDPPPAEQAAAQYPPTQAYPPVPPSQYPPTQTYPPVQPAQYPPTQAYPTPAVPAPAATEEDPFAGLFGSAPAAAPQPAAPASQSRVDDDPFGGLFPAPSTAAPVAGAPLSRRELRESEGHARSDVGGGGGRGASGGGNGGGDYGKPKKKRSLLWLKITLPIVLVLGAAGGVAAFGWFNYNEQVRELLGIPLPTDYEGSGNGTEVIVTIQSGDIGSDVANTLHEAGVTMTFDAVYDYLVENPDVGFMPGNWRLQEEMSAASAVDSLQNLDNKVTTELLLTEGTVLPNALEIISETTGIPLDELQTAALDLASFGLPAEAPTLEGYLFPATYELDGTETAHDLLQKLVDTMFEHLDAAGVAPEDRHRVLTMASIIQREAGWNIDDFYKVSRVFQNRIDQGINLESDATVAYGTGNLHTVWTTDGERADASNLYNTYANPGLPIGPIGLPGDDAIDAALHPVEGPWLFFVPINLATGETVFSETVEEHEAARDQLFAWCEASDENASYCE